jgi:hypothetical protein
MTALQQPSFFDVADEPRLGALAGRVQRTSLRDGAWVDHLPGWLDGSDDACSSGWFSDANRAEWKAMYTPGCDPDPCATQSRAPAARLE